MRINSNHSFHLLACLLLLAVSSCTSNQALPEKISTKSGYELKIVDRISEKRAIESDYIMYRSDITIGDTIINTSLLTGPYLFYQVKELGGNQNVSPVVEAFQFMNDGDSAILNYPLSAEEMKPDFFGDAQSLNYRIRIIKTLNSEEYGLEFRKITDQMSEESAVLLGREEEIKEFTQKVLGEFKEGKLDAELVDLGDGIKAFIHELGDGPEPYPGAFISVAYYGRLVESGEAFDDSFKRGKTFKFKLGVGTAIQAWDIALPQLSEGTKASIFVPNEIGYGKQGFPPSIGPDEDLYFYIELVEIIK